MVFSFPHIPYIVDIDRYLDVNSKHNHRRIGGSIQT